MSDCKQLAQFAMDQLDSLENVRCIPMMGGYIFYYRDRIFGGIYESGFMVKITKSSLKFMPDSVPKPPYSGAKDMLPCTLLENSERFCAMVEAMYDELPIRKKK